MATSPKNKKSIYLEPVNQIIKKLENTNKSNVMLIGNEGVGKTIVLREYTTRNSNPTNLIIDGTVDCRSIFSIADFKIFELNQICLLIQKMLFFIQTKYPDKFQGDFAGLEEKINYIIKIINLMHFYDNYTVKFNEIGKDIIENPEMLLEEFLEIATKTLSYETITIVLDNFDVVGGPSQHYQEYMYRTLSQYMRLVVTVSDSRVINNPERITDLEKTNDIVDVNYTQDIEIIKEILNSVFIQSSILSGNTKYRVSIDSMLSNETIALMVSKTNGNLFEILRAARGLYSRMGELSPSEYDAFVLDYLDREIIKNPILSGYTKQERRLLLK
ncbi:MAG: hypothetical protein E7161_03970 [Firmicutes bacterium]|nr:hypothetical protein [Bacillota bacterium]